MTVPSLPRLIASGGGCGFAPIAPGTVASAVALVAGALLLHVAPALVPAAALIAALAGLWSISAAHVAGDPGWVVIDEVAGQWITLLFCPADWRHGLIALILFRLFDITKPFPVRRLESLPEGWGIVFDDVAAGLYALGVASLLRIWI